MNLRSYFYRLVLFIVGSLMFLSNENDDNDSYYYRYAKKMFLNSYNLLQKNQFFLSLIFHHFLYE